MLWSLSLRGFVSLQQHSTIYMISRQRAKGGQHQRRPSDGNDDGKKACKDCMYCKLHN